MYERRERPVRYPELTADKLAPGVKFMTAYQRLERGWSFERAVSEPPREVKEPVPYAQRVAAREARIAARRAQFVAMRLKPKRKCTHLKGNRHRIENDTSPEHIRSLRKKFCEEFIKTGNLNADLAAKLKEYADECKSAKSNSARIPREQEAQNSRGRNRVGRDDGDRNDHQTHV